MEGKGALTPSIADKTGMICKAKKININRCGMEAILKDNKELTNLRLQE